MNYSPENGDVQNSLLNNEQNSFEGNEDPKPAEGNDEPQVNEPGSETTEDDYAKAWEKIDTENPSPELFTATTEDELSGEPGEADQLIPPPGENEPQVNNENGLVIPNPVLKFKGHEIPVETADEMLALAQKGFKLENEMSKIKPVKPFIKLVQEGLTVEMAKAVLDLSKGNQGALSYLKQMAGIKEETPSTDIFGNETQEMPPGSEDYKPEVPQTDPVRDFFSSVTEEKPALAGKVAEIYDSIDDEFKSEVYDPKVFPSFVTSIENGEFEKIYPYAMKARNLNPALTWLQAYIMAGQKISEGKADKPNVQTPPQGTKIPRSNAPKNRNLKMDYDTAFDLSLEELEEKLFS